MRLDDPISPKTLLFLRQVGATSTFLGTAATKPRRVGNYPRSVLAVSFAFL